MVEFLMTNKHPLKKIVSFCFLILLSTIFFSRCSSGNGTGIRIPAGVLEARGFEHFNPSDFDLLFGSDSLYIMNFKDRTVVCFKGDKPVASYAYPEGKNRRLKFAPKSIFFYNSKTIGIYDYGKSFVRLLSPNLEFIRDIPVRNAFLDLSVTGKGLTAFLYRHENVFAFLDGNFNIAKTFCPAERDLPFDGYYPRLLNQGFFLSPTQTAHTRWAQHEKKCKIDVYDLENLEKVLTLTWEKETQWNAEEFKKQTNCYFTIFAAKTGPYYVIQNSFLKAHGAKNRYLLLVFDESGTIIYNQEFPFRLIRFQKPYSNTETQVYYMDDHGDIVSNDIRSIMKHKKAKKEG